MACVSTPVAVSVKERSTSHIANCLLHSEDQAQHARQSLASGVARPWTLELAPGFRKLCCGRPAAFHTNATRAFAPSASLHIQQ